MRWLLIAKLFVYYDAIPRTLDRSAEQYGSRAPVRASRNILAERAYRSCLRGQRGSVVRPHRETVMPSNAYQLYLLPLLGDATEIEQAHQNLRTGQAGRQWGLGALNRAAVVMSLSAWEAYVEELIKESVAAFKPANPANTLWQSINADARSQIGRFNTPNVENVRKLIADTLGLQDVTLNWHWHNTTVQQARDRLTEAITHRHQIAHGVNPRPTIHNQYASRLPAFFTNLGLRTDRAVRDYLVNTIGVPNPWPQ